MRSFHDSLTQFDSILGSKVILLANNRKNHLAIQRFLVFMCQ